MKLTTKIFLLGIASLLICHLIGAQDVKSILDKDIEAAAGIYYPYHFEQSDFTPAPKGFKPVYVSHYGRHGSRYHTRKGYFEQSYLMMKRHEDILTPKGKEVLLMVGKLLEVHDGMEGQLSPRGAREHRAVAQRMYRNFKRVFKKRSEVHCLSSIYPRCLISMANFTSELKGLRPGLDFSFSTGEQYMKYILPRIDYQGPWDLSSALEDSLRASFNYRPLYEVLFTDPDVAMTEGLAPRDFARYLYAAGAISSDLDYDNVIFENYPRQCLEDQLATKTITFYSQYCNSEEYGDYTRAKGYEILQYLVDNADKALQKGSNVAADLRFGHDTGVVPLGMSMGLKEFSTRVPAAKSPEYTSVSYLTPMCTNIQVIFYQNRKGETLAKILFNERETSIPAINAATGPYYKWDDLRAYLLSEIDDFLLFHSRHESVAKPADS